MSAEATLSADRSRGLVIGSRILSEGDHGEQEVFQIDVSCQMMAWHGAAWHNIAGQSVSSSGNQTVRQSVSQSAHRYD